MWRKIASTLEFEARIRSEAMTERFLRAFVGQVEAQRTCVCAAEAYRCTPVRQTETTESQLIVGRNKFYCLMQSSTDMLY